MKTDPQQLDPFEEQGARLLGELKAVPPRDPERAERGRAQYLARATDFRDSHASVSPPVKARHKGWMTILTWRKEPIPMSTLATLIVIVSLLFGGAGATVVAAQGSQPDQPLYGLKLTSEDARLELAAKTQTRLELALQFAERRIEELAGLVRAGKPVPATLAARWQQQAELALRLAGDLDDGVMNGELTRLRDRLREQLRLMDQLQGDAPADAQLLRLREQLQTRLRLVEAGLADPTGYRNQVRAGQYDLAPVDPGQEEPPAAGPGYGPGPGDGECQDCTPQGPGAGNKAGEGNPWVEGTPTPGSGYGAGNGGNPWTDSTPTPGSGYGPGEGDCGACTPQGPGPQPTTSSPGPGPGGQPTASGGGGTGGKKP